MNASRSFNNAAASSLNTSPSTRGYAVNMESILANLNPAQRRAVTHDPSIPLQILAGPGSGKTKVLTSRIAHLITEHKLEPSSICAVTFTNKAANEMRYRLSKLIGYKATSALQIGTFHSICAQFLRRYASSVDLDPNFTICDASDSKYILNRLLQQFTLDMIEHGNCFTASGLSTIISKEKARGRSAAMVLAEAEELQKAESKRDPLANTSKAVSGKHMLAEIYSRYASILKENNALDFDDLLVYGVKLFRDFESAALWCNHILVDEFQDTNIIQYELMTAIAARKCVTIVGDPDQSIYGWRSAEVANLSRMTKDFSPVEKILLETNYRSTSAILRSSLAIVAEDKKRIPKSLNTSHPLGPIPFVGKFYSEKDEAAFMVSEIKRCIANMGGVLKWGDFAILLRFNALSRPFEVALQREGVPWKILGGHKFFERAEVKDILSYLQLVDNPSYSPAFVRTIKVPTRGVGDKTMEGIASLAEKMAIPRLTVIERIFDGTIPDIKPTAKRKVASYVTAIRALRKLDEENTPPSAIIRELVKLIDYEEYLRKTHEDWESRWENIQELITFAKETEEALPVQTASSDEDAPESSKKPDSKLRQFLQVSMLSSEGDNQSEDDSHEKVVLTTCHAAKGLEWPVVMIPSVDNSTFPFYRTEDVDEERRLLYVACTRAQSLLYMSCSHRRMVAGVTEDKSLSDFVKFPQRKNQALFTSEVPRFSPEARTVVSQVLHRDLPDEAEIERKLEEYENTGERVLLLSQDAPGGSYTLRVKSGPAKSEFNLAPVYASPDQSAKKRPRLNSIERVKLEKMVNQSLGQDSVYASQNWYNRRPSPSPTRRFDRGDHRVVEQRSFSPTFKSASSAFARHPHPVTTSPSALANRTTGRPSSRQDWSEKHRSRGDDNSRPNWRSHEASPALPSYYSSHRQHPRPDTNLASSRSPGPSQHAGPSRASQRENFRHSAARYAREDKSQSSFDSKHAGNVTQPPPSPPTRRDVLMDLNSFNQMRKSTGGNTVLAPSRSFFSPYRKDNADSSARPPSPDRTALQDSNPNQLASLTAQIPSKPLPTLPTSEARPQAESSSGWKLPTESQGPPTNNSLKRRLGMSARLTGGYSNKKFKPPN